MRRYIIRKEGKNKMALYLVATPIGNLSEMSPRAQEVLRKAELVLCEDTAHSAKLMRFFEIDTPLKSCHKFSEAKVIPPIIERLKSGADIALITDAGMPCVSDPGSRLVTECHNHGIEVLAVSGPSSVVSAAALSGMCGEGFVFVGFLPEKNKDRVKKITAALESALPVIVFCAPHNIVADLEFLYSIAGNRRAAVIKEISKLYERTRVIMLEDYRSIEPKGEFVVVIEAQDKVNPLLEMSPQEHLNHHIGSGMSKSDAVKLTAAERGVAKNEIYQLTVGK